MRLPPIAVVFSVFAGIVGCGKPGRLAGGAPTRPPQAQIPVTPVAETPPAPPLVETPPRAPLVVRGVLEPTHADSNMTACPEVLGGRHGAAPISIHLDEPRTLYVFAKARGPIGIAAAAFSDRCAAAGANKWARLVIPAEYEDVTIPIMDVDVDGERRGQTSPFVVVVSEIDEEPTLEPAFRGPAPSGSDVVVRWAVTPRACDPGIEYFRCSNATIELSDANGKLLKRVPLKKGLTGQLGCWPQGTGVHCGGPSGMTNITLENATDGSGSITVLATSESDGYCPETEDCSSREKLATFTVPRGARLVADPAGTWPPAIMR